MSPREALEGGDSGRFKLPFPTTRNLIKLGKQPNVKAALENPGAKAIVTVMPIMTKRTAGASCGFRSRPATTASVFEVGAAG